MTDPRVMPLFAELIASSRPRLTMSDPNDWLFGFGGNDSLEGQAGEDLVEGGAGTDTLDGGSGLNDAASWIFSSAPITASLTSGTASGDGPDSMVSVEPLVGAPVLREFAVRTPVTPDVVVDRLAEEGFLAGIPLDEEYGTGLLVAATERRTRAQIDAYAAAFEKVARS